MYIEEREDYRSTGKKKNRNTGKKKNRNTE